MSVFIIQYWWCGAIGVLTKVNSLNMGMSRKPVLSQPKEQVIECARKEKRRIQIRWMARQNLTLLQAYNNTLFFSHCLCSNFWVSFGALILTNQRQVNPQRSQRSQQHELSPVDTITGWARCAVNKFAETEGSVLWLHQVKQEAFPLHDTPMTQSARTKLEIKFPCQSCKEKHDTLCWLGVEHALLTQP